MTLADRMIVMNAGVAEQIGTPMEVYDRPATIFVAGFIGSPAMNFLAAKVGQGGQVGRSRRHRRATARQPAAARGRPRRRPARRWRSGCGPSTCSRRATGRSQFEVELAEPLGADTLLHGRFGEARELVTVRQGGHVIAQPGEKRRFSAAPAPPPVRFADRPAHRRRLTTPP